MIRNSVYILYHDLAYKCTGSFISSKKLFDTCLVNQNGKSNTMCPLFLNIVLTKMYII